MNEVQLKLSFLNEVPSANVSVSLGISFLFVSFACWFHIRAAKVQ